MFDFKMIYEGYYGIFSQPYALKNNQPCNIYYLQDMTRGNLFLIPLETSFYKDCINIISGLRFTPNMIYIIVQDISIAFTSDYFLLWSYIKNDLELECKLLSRFLPEDFSMTTLAKYKSDFDRRESNQYIFNNSKSHSDVTTISISLIKDYVSGGSPFLCDIKLATITGKKLFVGEMNEAKADYLNHHLSLYDEIHIPHIKGNYGGMSYNKLLKKYPALTHKVVANNFGSFDELDYARNHGVTIGKQFKFTKEGFFT